MAKRQPICMLKPANNVWIIHALVLAAQNKKCCRRVQHYQNYCPKKFCTNPSQLELDPVLMKFLSNLTITFTQVFILANAIIPSDSCSKSSRWLINGQWYIFTRARLHYNQLIRILDRWFVPPVCPCGRSQNINLMCSQCNAKCVTI